MPPRRNRIPNEVRRRIVRAFENPTEDYQSAADTLGVKRSTARSIEATYLRVKEEEKKDLVADEITLELIVR